MSIGRVKLSEYIAYLKARAAELPGDPEICYCDWLVQPEVYELANGEICVAEGRKTPPKQMHVRPNLPLSAFKAGF